MRAGKQILPPGEQLNLFTARFLQPSAPFSCPETETIGLVSQEGLKTSVSCKVTMVVVQTLLSKLSYMKRGRETPLVPRSGESDGSLHLLHLGPLPDGILEVTSDLWQRQSGEDTEAELLES